MLTTMAAIIGGAVLFALFGALQPASRCEHNCDGCATACSRREQQDQP